MLDLNGFFTSTEFLTQVASVVSAVLSILLGDFLARFFSGTA